MTLFPHTVNNNSVYVKNSARRKHLATAEDYRDSRREDAQQGHLGANGCQRLE